MKNKIVVALSLMAIAVQAKYEMVWDQDSAQYRQVDVRRSDDRIQIRDFETGETSYGRVNSSGRAYMTDVYGDTYQAEIRNNGRINVREF